MRTKGVVVFVLACALWPMVPALSAAEDALLAQQDTARLAPLDRVRLNAEKARQFPLLRGRWDPRTWRPASSSNFVPDNLAMDILSELGRDKALSGTPMRLKVRTLRGDVVLEGVVNDESQKRLVENKVRRLPRVKKVQNNLRVKTSDSDLLQD